MNKLLKQAIGEVSKLPDGQQEAIALHNPARSRLINCHSSPKGYTDKHNDSFALNFTRTRRFSLRHFAIVNHPTIPRQRAGGCLTVRHKQGPLVFAELIAVGVAFGIRFADGRNIQKNDRLFPPENADLEFAIRCCWVALSIHVDGISLSVAVRDVTSALTGLAKAKLASVAPVAMIP